MVELENMRVGAQKLVNVCANVQQGERVLVVTDMGRSQRIADTVFEAALREGASVSRVVLEELPYPGAEPPDSLAAAMKASDVIFALTTTSLYHTQARVEACEAGARVIVCTEITEDMLVEGGIEANFVELRPMVEDLANKMSQASEVRLTTSGGTDIQALTGKRRAHAITGLAHRKGEAMGPPDIEVFVAPLEGTGEGTLVVDASATSLGLIRSPIRIIVHAGRAMSITGGMQAEQLHDLLENMRDPNSWNLAEIAIGLNPKARVTGNIIEDEGALGTCHVALGNNITFGGNNCAKLHIDLVMWHPTLYLDGNQVFSAAPNS